jgi:hypothetical protein
MLIPPEGRAIWFRWKSLIDGDMMQLGLPVGKKMMK